MDQIADLAPLSFAVVPLPSGYAAVTLAFQNGRLLGQLTWKGWAPEYRHKIPLGHHVFDGKIVYYPSGPYGEAEYASIEAPDAVVLKAWNGGLR